MAVRASETTLASLPEDVRFRFVHFMFLQTPTLFFKRIFSSLGAAQLSRVARVCKDWNRLSGHEIHWKPLYLQRWDNPGSVADAGGWKKGTQDALIVACINRSKCAAYIAKDRAERENLCNYVDDGLLDAFLLMQEVRVNTHLSLLF